MHITHIKLTNILGISELEFDAGQFTEISGRNGQGKTSVLEAIKATLQGGHDATLLRRGADKGEAVLVLDDGTEIRKTVTGASSTTKVLRNGKVQPRPADLIRSITDMLSVNPVDFLRAPKRDRVRVLLEAMPLTADTEHLAQISGVPVKAQEGVHALHVIQSVYQQVYDDRTGTNRAVREKESTINQLRAAMPEAPGGVEGDEDTLRRRLDEVTQRRDAELERVRVKLDGIKADAASKVQALRDDLQVEIDALRAAAQESIDAINADCAESERKAAAQREKTVNSHAAAAQPLTTALAGIRSNRADAARRSATLQTIATMETELAVLSGDAQRQTAALAAIESYKSDLLDSLPVSGLEVREGEIYRGDVPFDRLNTAQQVEIAIEIAKLRAGALGVLCVDGLELLDSAAYEAFRDSTLTSGLQLFVSRVGDDDIAVNTSH